MVPFRGKPQNLHIVCECVEATSMTLCCVPPTCLWWNELRISVSLAFSLAFLPSWRSRLELRNRNGTASRLADTNLWSGFTSRWMLRLYVFYCLFELIMVWNVCLMYILFTYNHISKWFYHPLIFPLFFLLIYSTLQTVLPILYVCCRVWKCLPRQLLKYGNYIELFVSPLSYMAKRTTSAVVVDCSVHEKREAATGLRYLRMKLFSVFYCDLYYELLYKCSKSMCHGNKSMHRYLFGFTPSDNVWCIR